MAGRPGKDAMSCIAGPSASNAIKQLRRVDRSCWLASWPLTDGIGRDFLTGVAFLQKGWPWRSSFPGATNIGLFIGAALVLLLIPGPAVLYIVARSVAQGRMAGFVSDLGIHSATLVHVLAAALGLSALLASSALAFSIVKYAGAAYLIWLGLKKIFGRAEEVDADGNLPRHSYAHLFRDGFIVNLLNPKTALFFLAFLPQFVEPERGHLVTQVVFLGLLFAVLGFITDGCYAFLAGTAGKWLRQSRRYLEVERYVSGTLFIGLGLTAAFAGSQKK
jgi:threonine/homoserine/homoserine lactone efflux protein